MRLIYEEERKELARAKARKRAAEKHKIKMETERRELEALRMLVPKAKKKDLPKYREQGVIDILLRGMAASDAVCA